MYEHEENFLRPYLDKAAKVFSNLSNEVLEKALNDDISLHSLFGDIEEFDKIENKKEEMLNKIKSSAQFNLSKESRVVENMQLIVRLNLVGEKLMESVEDKIRQLGSTSMETALFRLKTAADSVEKESDKVADDFLNGSLDLDAFLENFISSRNIMHLRKFKLEKLSDLIERRWELML